MQWNIHSVLLLFCMAEFQLNLLDFNCFSSSTHKLKLSYLRKSYLLCCLPSLKTCKSNQRKVTTVWNFTKLCLHVFPVYILFMIEIHDYKCPCSFVWRLNMTLMLARFGVWSWSLNIHCLRVSWLQLVFVIHTAKTAPVKSKIQLNLKN